MKKSFNVKLGNFSFNMDEDACAFLEKQLALLADKYKNKGEELKLAEEESNIADKLINIVGENGIVTIDIIKQILDEDIPFEDETTNTTEKESEEVSAGSDNAWQEAKSLGRKLFRNPYNSVLAGVLSGIAGYFGINTLLLRVLFVVATLSLSFGITIFPIILFYILLWMFIPKAKNIIDLTRSFRPTGNTYCDMASDEVWRMSYEYCRKQMTYPERDGCLYSMFKLLLMGLFVIMALPLLVFMFLLLLCFVGLLFALFMVYGAALFVNGYFLLLAGVPLLMLIHWILKKCGVLRPMNKYIRAGIIVAWLFLFSYTCVRLYEKIEEAGGMDFLKSSLIDKRFTDEGFWENFLEENFGEFVEEVAYSYSVWMDGNNDIPFIIDAKRSSAFNKITIRFIEPHLWKEKDALQDFENNYISSVELDVNDMDSGSVYCFWDSISKEVYIDLNVTDNIGNSIHLNSYELPVKFAPSPDGVGFFDAAANGKIPFEIRFSRGKRPELYMWGTDTDEGVFVQPMETLSSWSYSANNYLEHKNDSACNVTLTIAVDDEKEE